MADRWMFICLGLVVMVVRTEEVNTFMSETATTNSSLIHSISTLTTSNKTAALTAISASSVSRPSASPHTMNDTTSSSSSVTKASTSSSSPSVTNSVVTSTNPSIIPTVATQNSTMDSNTETPGYKGVEAVAGVCIILVSAVIIGIAICTARLEKHTPKFNKNEQRQARIDMKQTNRQTP